MAPMAGAKSDHEPNAHSRIAASVLGERTRARQLTHATAQLAQMETALQTFLAQTTPVEQEESRTELMEAIDQIHGQELLRALIRDQVDTKQRSRWLLAANTALQHPLYDGSASGLNRRFRAARDSLLSLLSLAGDDETAVQIALGLVRQTQQGYLWRTGIVDGEELASDLLEGIDLEGQRPASALTDSRKVLVLKAVYQEAVQWLQATSIGDVERIYFATLMNKLMESPSPEVTPRSDSGQPQPSSLHVVTTVLLVFLILSFAAIALNGLHPRIPWQDFHHVRIAWENLIHQPRPKLSAPKLAQTLGDLPDGEIRRKSILVRVDLDILDVGGTLTPTGPWQIQQTLTVVRELLNRGASKVILAAHTHRDLPMGYVRTRLQEVSDKDTIEIELPKLRFRVFNKAQGGRRLEMIQREPEGTVILLDNLAADPRESASNPGERVSLAQELAQLADVYINDAPNASQEARASTVEVVSLVPVVAVGPALAAELQAIAEQPEKRRRSALRKLPAVAAMHRAG
jgi:hypothetical protein